MSVRFRSLIFSLLVLVCLGTNASAENLYHPAGGELFTSLNARNVGDILTVIIAESTRAEREVGTTIEKQPTYSGGLMVEGFFDVLSGLNSVIEPIRDIDIDPKEEFESSASTEAEGRFSGRLTVVVREVLPNGNLRVEGRRTMQINKETEVLSLTGVVRGYDIAPNNTIQSTQLADVAIEFTGKGVVSRSQKVGLLGKLFNLIF